MSRPASNEGEVIPRPAKTPAALKAALAVVATNRLQEMVEGQTRAMAEAIDSGNVQPLRTFVDHWAAIVEIERVPRISQAYHRANYLANHAGTLDECRQHAIEVAEIHRAACAAVTG